MASRFFPSGSFLASACKLFGVIAACLGGVFGVYQYLDDKHEKRMRNALDYAEQFDSGKLSTARKETRIFVTLKSEEFFMPEMSRRETNYEDIHEVTKITGSTAFIQAVDKSQRDSILLIVRFIDRVTDCVKVENCDEQSIKKNFGSVVTQFAIYFGKYINELKINDEDPFGRGIDYLVEPRILNIIRLSAEPMGPDSRVDPHGAIG